MFTKKVILPVAALAMTALVGCGDDSSSSGPSYDVAPASVKTFMDIDKIPCSPTQNLCAKVLTEDYNDYYQCNGTQWNMMIMGQDTPVKGCENAAPAAETPADPAAETPADPAAETPADPAAETPADPAAETPADPAAETPADPAAETPADPAAETPADPAAETPADPAAETPAVPGAEEPATGTVGCMKAGICSEGPAAMASECTAEEGEELLDACPAGGEACDIGEEGITMYFYADAPMSCADYKAMIAAFSNMAQ